MVISQLFEIQLVTIIWAAKSDPKLGLMNGALRRLFPTSYV